MRVPRFLFYGALLSLVAVGARGQDKTVPEQETEFCVIAENSNSAYRALARDRAEAEKRQNGIRVHADRASDDCPLSSKERRHLSAYEEEELFSRRLGSNSGENFLSDRKLPHKYAFMYTC